MRTETEKQYQILCTELVKLVGSSGLSPADKVTSFMTSGTVLLHVSCLYANNKEVLDKHFDLIDELVAGMKEEIMKEKGWN